MIATIVERKFTFHYELIITVRDRCIEDAKTTFTFHYELIITSFL